MSILQTADALNRFLASHGMDAKGVRVVIEFDDVGKAIQAQHYMQEEFSVGSFYGRFDPPKIKETKVLSIPFSFMAKIA